MAFSPDGRWLASGSRDATARIWDPADGRPLQVLAAHSDRVMGLAFSPDARLLATGSRDRSITLWDTASWNERRTLGGHSGFVDAVAFSPDGRWLASAGADQTIKIWSVVVHQSSVVSRPTTRAAVSARTSDTPACFRTRAHASSVVLS